MALHAVKDLSTQLIYIYNISKKISEIDNSCHI